MAWFDLKPSRDMSWVVRYWCVVKPRSVLSGTDVLWYDLKPRADLNCGALRWPVVKPRCVVEWVELDWTGVKGIVLKPRIDVMRCGVV